MKTSNDTYKWFRRDYRPARPEDALGIYRFTSRPLLPRIAKGPDACDQWILYTLAGIEDPEALPMKKTWNEEGSVVLPDVFSWLRDADVLSKIHEEYDMYLHHQREISGRHNFGWLRNMYHSFAQQVVRRDPVYYMLYCLLRKDHPWKMISYPYYAKYTQPGDRTFFRHIDINVPQWIASGRGKETDPSSLATNVNTIMSRHNFGWTILAGFSININCQCDLRCDQIITLGDQEAIGQIATLKAVVEAKNAPFTTLFPKPNAIKTDLQAGIYFYLDDYDSKGKLIRGARPADLKWSKKKDKWRGMARCPRTLVICSVERILCP